MPGIEIVAMRTWGELGNLLAAKTLAAALGEGADGLPCQVVEAESLFPRFAGIGESIRRVATTPAAPQVRFRRYLDLMDEIAPLFPPGLEEADVLPEPLESEIRPMAEHFAATRPDLVVGTKGVISRLCRAALRRAGGPAPVVNFVTNQGLLELAIHRSRTIPWHLVPTEAARRLLVEEHGFDPATVRMVGRLIARTNLGEFFERGGAAGGDGGEPLPGRASEVRLVVFSNRGGRPYLRLLRHLAERHPEIDLVFIGYNDPTLAAAAERLKVRHDLAGWRVFERLEQGAYLRYLAWLTSARYPLLISKTGPNTMLEAAYFGIPQLLLFSGLPMERWVGPYVGEAGVGMGFERMADLIATLDRWLAAPGEIAARRERALELSRTVMDQERTKRRLKETFAEILAGAPAAGKESEC